MIEGFNQFVVWFSQGFQFLINTLTKTIVTDPLVFGERLPREVWGLLCLSGCCSVDTGDGTNVTSEIQAVS